MHIRTCEYLHAKLAPVGKALSFVGVLCPNQGHGSFNQGWVAKKVETTKQLPVASGLTFDRQCCQGSIVKISDARGKTALKNLHIRLPGSCVNEDI